jgi:hypothetical protein
MQIIKFSLISGHLWPKNVGDLMVINQREKSK